MIPEKSYTQSSCKALANTGFPTTAITCQFLASAPDGYVGLRILSAFRRQIGASGVEYRFVLSGI